jgi:cell division protease FtsH
MASRREDYSEATAREIDEEVRRIVESQYKVARDVVRQHTDKLNRLAEALLERETLDSEEIEAALEGRPLPERQRVVIPTWSEKQKTRVEKKRPASIFGAPKPAPSS